MKIGFYGNANNYPFMLARALRRAGHEVLFLVASRERLNRPEHRYSDIPTPYPPWIVDVSHRFRWHCLTPGPGRTRVLEELNACDAVILNEEGPALAAGLHVPYTVLLTGSDVEIFANPEKAKVLKLQVVERPAWLQRVVACLVPDWFVVNRLIAPQRAGLLGARAVFFLPYGLAPGADRLLDEIGVTAPKRRELLFTDTELASFSPQPHHTPLRIVSATRLTWLPDAAMGLTLLDLKGSDVMIRGLAEFSRRTGCKLDIHLVRKGRHVRETETLIHEVGLAEQVTWHDEMSQQAVLTLFRDADIVIEQLAQSAVGMAGLDAMSTGRPLIANGRPEIIERIALETSTILQANTPGQVATHLETLAASPERREKIGRESRAYVERHFSTNVAVTMFLAALTPFPTKLEGDISPAPRKRRLRTTLLWITKFGITAAIMAFVFNRIVDWPALTRAANSFPLSALALIFALHLLQRWVVAWQTRLALAHAGVALSTPRIFQIHLITSFFSVVLPGELAGAAVSWHLFSRDSGRRSQTAAALIYLRLISLSMLVLVGTVGIFIEPRLIALHAHWAVLIAGTIVGLPLLSFHAPKVAQTLKRISDTVTGCLPWTGLRSAFRSFWSSVHEFTALRLTTQLSIWIAAVTIYLINVIAGLIAMHAAQINAPSIAIVWLLAIVSLVSLVPFTVGGFGVRELGVAVLLRQWYDVPTESAVLLSLALGTVGFLASAGLGGLALTLETVFGHRWSRQTTPAQPAATPHSRTR